MVGKLKERNYNSLNVHGRAAGGTERGEGEEKVWKESLCDILLWGIPGPGLVNSLKLVFGVSDPDCCSATKICHPVVFIKQDEQHPHVCNHTRTHGSGYKAIFPQQIIDIVDTLEEELCFFRQQGDTAAEKQFGNLSSYWAQENINASQPDCETKRSFRLFCEQKLWRDLPPDTATCRGEFSFSPPSVRRNKAQIYQSVADVVLSTLQGQQNSISRARDKSWAGKVAGVLTNRGVHQPSQPRGAEVG